MNLSFERDPIASQPISILVPVHNSGERVRAFLDEAKKAIGSLAQPCELLVIDEGSTDDTARFVEEKAAQFPEVKLLRQPSFSGEGHAVREGLAAAQHPLVFVLPLRAGISPNVLPQFLAEIDAVDCVAGVREGLGRWQRFRSGGSGWWLFGVRLADAACPVRLYRKSVFRWPLQSNGPFVHIEIAAKANFAGCLMSEVNLPAVRADGLLAGEPNGWRELNRLFNWPRFQAKSTDRGHHGLASQAAVEAGA